MTDADRARAERAIADGLDWDRWLAAAQVHGVRAMCHRHAVAGSIVFPDGVRRALDAGAMRLAQRNLDLTARLRDLLVLFDGAGIRAVPLKGLTLAERVYGASTLRRIGDLDLAVYPADYERAIALLTRNGFEPTLKFPEGYTECEERFSHHRVFAMPGTSYPLELHRHLLSDQHGWVLTLEWAGPLRSASFHGAPALEMSNEALFVYLVLHGSGHAWDRLEWIVAARELLLAGCVRDWDEVTRLARAAHAVRRVGAAIALMESMLGPIPTAPRAPVNRRERRANAAVISAFAQTRGKTGAFARSLAYGVRTDDTLTDTARRVAALLIRPWPQDVRAVPLPPRWWRAYHAVHLARVTGTLSWAAIGAIARRIPGLVR